jgi:hypothetical protein
LIEQIRLVAWLRWYILRNSFRNKSRRLDLLGLIFSSIFSALFVIGITIAFFLGTKSLLNHHHQQFLGLFFLALFLWWQLFPILLAGFTPQFAFRSLLRFPLKHSTFYLIGIAYGLADSAAIAAVIWMLAMIAAALFAAPLAAPMMAVVCVVFAALNATIERFVGAWVEKLMAKRRSREFFFSLFILAMVGLQFLNPLMQKYSRTIVPLVRGWLPYLWLLPSSFAGDAVARAVNHEWVSALGKLLGLTTFLAAFTALLWLRYKRLYSGEELSEGLAPARRERRTAISGEENELMKFLPARILAVFRKELLYLRRNTFLFFGLIFPPMMLLFFSVQFGGAHPTGLKRGLRRTCFSRE